MNTLIATLALASIVATSAVAAPLNRNYPCPEYNHAAQTCGVQKAPNTPPNNGSQNDNDAKAS